MRIAATSDLHGNLPEIEEADVLLICGDLVPLSIQRNIPESKMWFAVNFKNWCENISVKHILFIPGNHDLFLERDRADYLFAGTNIQNIQDKEVEIDGVKFYGCPWCKVYGHWSFMLHENRLIEEYSKIPEGLDILITHDAPNIGYVGMIPYRRSGGIVEGEYIDASNPWLAAEIRRKKPTIALCGHIHEGDHNWFYANDTRLANVSLLNDAYQITYPILYFDYEKS